MSSRHKPTVTRVSAPDRTAQEAALRLLMERTPAKPGRPSAAREKQRAGR